MFDFSKRRSIAFAVVGLTLFFFMAQPLIFAQTAGKGNLAGFVYDKDGSTPVEGAVVKIKNLKTDAVFESPKTDAQGAFQITGIDPGLYIFGVTSPVGDFNANEVIGIAENETAKLSVALKPISPAQPVDPKAQDAPQIRGEKWIGKVISYDPASKEARIYINRDEVKKDENFHAKGDKDKYKSETDFWQKLKQVKQNGFEVKKAQEGQYYNISLEKPVLANDFIYIKERRGLIYFFMGALGVAAILAGTTAVIYYVVTPPVPVSQSRY